MIAQHVAEKTTSQRSEERMALILLHHLASRLSIRPEYRRGGGVTTTARKQSATGKSQDSASTKSL